MSSEVQNYGVHEAAIDIRFVDVHYGDIRSLLIKSGVPRLDRTRNGK